jgi:RsiW-degrading membrane proteinase PrsW (M82 family)
MQGRSYWLILLVVSPALLTLIIGTWQSALLLIFGVAAAIGSAIVENGIFHTVEEYGFALSAGGKAFFLFALPEELFKYFATTSVAGNSASGRTLVKSAVVVAIGFAIAENCIYVIGFANNMTESMASVATLLRLFLPFSMHLVCAPILMCGHVIRNFKPIGGIFLAIMLHGIYDTLSLGNTVVAVKLSYLVIILSSLFAGIVYRQTGVEKR